MKNFSLIILAILTATSSLLMTSCQKQDPDRGRKGNILPEKFRVDVPNSLSNSNFTQKDGISGKTGVAATDTLQGNQMYKHLTNFIAVGDGAGEIAENIILAIATYDIDHAMTLSFTSNQDGRTKNLEVIEGSSFESVNYEFEMTITDALSESEPDGGKALQVFWDVSPIKGVAIVKPFNSNVGGHPELGEAMFRIDYTNEGSQGYDEHMTVYISDLPLPSPLVNPYAIDNMKMFVGKNGDQVDVYGNSNHPNAIFLSGTTGFNWAFAASGDVTDDIAVAEVGLPQSSLSSTDRQVILVDNSVKQVFEDEIYAAWPNIDSATVVSLLFNTAAPGYFDANGFIAGGQSPGQQYDDLEIRSQALTPFSPAAIAALLLEFK